jgi:hypothetical protein
MSLKAVKTSITMEDAKESLNVLKNFYLREKLEKEKDNLAKGKNVKSLDELK